ncbi:hypothetical protein [Acinetobacter bereziniae]|uniref:hypothetical protein n=1 Tax=Acinetobacter bereziniae TaxID=106648 RepID=UPI0021E41C01|nr:hypothetical protein [Acinetobacter bereziniae]MCV2444888.1 hypothetical protein [Acinetobacter bereziniae]
MGIGSSPTVGKTSQNCLQEFTIHFRRAEDRVFDGRYGFDWYRPEFYKNDLFNMHRILLSGWIHMD